MQLSNFKMISADEGCQVLATVDVTSGFWFFKFTRTRMVGCMNSTLSGLPWRFQDTGAYTPSGVVEKMFADFNEK